MGGITESIFFANEHKIKFTANKQNIYWTLLAFTVKDINNTEKDAMLSEATDISGMHSVKVKIILNNLSMYEINEILWNYLKGGWVNKFNKYKHKHKVLVKEVEF